MTKVDQFESVFKAATKPVFTRAEISLRNILVVTDLELESAERFTESVRSFLSVAGRDDRAEWQTLATSDFEGVGDLLEKIEHAPPDMICAYRFLKSDAWRWPHSLGEILDVLTQATPHPILVLPHPKATREVGSHTLQNLDRVMAITDHLAGDDRLVNYAARFTAADGQLYLTHLEDALAFERLIEVISKVPSIDTETAREEILARLLKEPHDYIISCRQALGADGDPAPQIEEIVTLGHRLNDYRRLVEENEIDLLVLNTKDEDQLAMHGMAYPLAVELVAVPMLML